MVAPEGRGRLFSTYLIFRRPLSDLPAMAVRYAAGPRSLSRASGFCPIWPSRQAQRLAIFRIFQKSLDCKIGSPVCYLGAKTGDQIMSAGVKDENFEKPTTYLSGTIYKKIIPHANESNRTSQETVEYYKGMIALAIYCIEYEDWIEAFKLNNTHPPGRTDVDAYNVTWHEKKISDLKQRSEYKYFDMIKNYSDVVKERRSSERMYKIKRLFIFSVAFIGYTIIIIYMVKITNIDIGAAIGFLRSKMNLTW